MKKAHLFLILLILSLTFGLNIFAQELDKLEEVKTQIHILNLLNGLELSKEQMQIILEAAKEAQNSRLKAKELTSQKEAEITTAYKDVLSVAQTGSLVIPDNIASKVHKINQEIDKIKESFQEEISTLSIKIKNNLKPHQLYVLDDYKPCIIVPVKQGRIGQADDAVGFSKVLERVHSMPEERYGFRKNQIAQNAIDKLKAKLPPGFIIDESQLRAKLLEAMDKARTISDIDFTLQKEEIARNIKAQLLPERPSINIGVKIEHFLLPPEIIPILEQRISSQQKT